MSLFSVEHPHIRVQTGLHPIARAHIYGGLFLAIALMALPVDAAQSAAAAPTQVTIQVGTRSITTGKHTAQGTPVVPMWAAPQPTTDPAAGFPLLAAAEHAMVWQPASRNEGAYNHHTALVHYQGRLFAMWDNHPTGEGGAGQRVLFAWSDAWGEWSAMHELLPAPGPIRNRNEAGIHYVCDRWLIHDETLYAIAYAGPMGTWTRAATAASPCYPVARAVARDGTLGEPFLLRPLPAGSDLPEYMQDYRHSEPQAALAQMLQVRYLRNNTVSWFSFLGEGVPAAGIDGAELIEPFTYRARDGGYVLLMRAWGHPRNPVHNNRMYVSFSNNLYAWSAPQPTDIPDSPSRAEAVTLANGTVLLIGNQIAHTLDTGLYLDRDPLTVAVSADGLVFNRVYALRADAPRSYRFAGVSGRNLGFGYSSSLVHDGWLYTLYSIGKEDIGITRVPSGEWLMAND
jgi:hypothetical protein